MARAKPGENKVDIVPERQGLGGLVPLPNAVTPTQFAVRGHSSEREEDQPAAHNLSRPHGGARRFLLPVFPCAVFTGDRKNVISFT